LFIFALSPKPFVIVKESKPNRKSNKWLVFTSMPFQIGATIYLFYWIGTLLDEKYQIDGGWWSKGLAMFGVVVSLYQFIRQANRMNKDE